MREASSDFETISNLCRNSFPRGLQHGVVATLRDLRCFARDRIIYLKILMNFFFIELLEICNFRSVLFLNDIWMVVFHRLKNAGDGKTLWKGQQRVTKVTSITRPS